VMPTLLELLGVSVPPAVQGTSLLPLARGERLSLMALSESWFPRFHYGWSELQAIQDERFKLIRAPRRELYDLERDPLETADLAASDPRRVETLERALDERLAAAGGGGTPRVPEAVDSETAERLLALGYIGGSVSARHLENRPRGDPKDKIQLYNLLKQASTASAEVRLEEAIAKASKALAEDPEILEGVPQTRSRPTNGRWRSTPTTRRPPSASRSPTRTRAVSTTRARASRAHARSTPGTGGCSGSSPTSRCARGASTRRRRF